MVSFIVLSPSDNCFAMAPQMRKLWVCVKVWATGYVYTRARACAASIHRNVFSNNHFVNCFSVASFSLCFQKTANSQCDLTKKPMLKPMLKFCGSHRSWCLRMDFVVSGFMLTVLWQTVSHRNPHQAIVQTADLLCLLAQPTQTWKCGKYGTIDLPGELNLMG